MIRRMSRRTLPADALERHANQLDASGAARGPIPSRDQIEEIRRSYANRWFAVLRDPQIERHGRALLKHRDPKVRLEMWRTVLMYLMPVAAGDNQQAGGAGVNLTLINHVPRPEAKVADAGGAGTREVVVVTDGDQSGSGGGD